MKHAIRFFVPSKIVALALLIFSLGFGIASWRLGLWANGSPGVGLTPILGCIVLFPISAMMLLDGTVADEPEAPLEGTPFLAGLGFCLMIYAMTIIGFVAPSLIFVLVWTRVLYGRDWKTSLLSAAGVTAALAVLFVTVLGVPMQLWPW
jgi:hypothetical protein